MSTPSTPLKKTANYYYGLGIFVAFFLAVIQIVSALSEDTCRPSVSEYPNAQLNFMALVKNYRNLYVRVSSIPGLCGTLGNTLQQN
ncbi:hypothetical protein [Endozoicomonas sp. 2B-B]